MPPMREQSVRERLNKLIQNGLATKVRLGVYSITEKGTNALMKKKPQDLPLFYPPLTIIPDVHYRAFVELIYAAIVARSDEISSDHHPFFVIAGASRKTWKTRLGRFLCLSLGLDPDTHICNVPVESGRSLFMRKDSRGKRYSLGKS
jgi:hypothetical protein